ncbi:TRAP transporter small permease [Hasllibacter sp. MH4015]|uniref:TRAP transporter small permease n=1 Tax=Hasllibacter sp. MH4015 TaxID=2854029 RepID=UPI001CD4894F|nr:TRAP transporter small permease [Hasllibacter sp. MH4015]
MYRTLLFLSRLLAILGGLMLSVLVLLTVFNVVMRAADRVFFWMIDTGTMAGLGQWMIDAGVGPMLGTFELIEAGIAFVIFSFIPICQITGGHASVDIFTSQMSDGANRVLRAVTELIFAAVLILIATQLYGGLLTKFNSGQTTLELQMPVWYSYAISLVGAVLAAIVAAYISVVRIVELVTRRAILPPDLGAEH